MLSNANRMNASKNECKKTHTYTGGDVLHHSNSSVIVLVLDGATLWKPSTAFFTFSTAR